MSELISASGGMGNAILGLAALAALEAGYQVAVMAPTEILAEQHLHSFRS